MQNKINYYKKKIHFVKKKSEQTSKYRLAIGLLLFLTLMSFSFQPKIYLLFILLVLSLIFYYLVKKHQNINLFEKELDTIHKLYLRHHNLQQGKTVKYSDIKIPDHLISPRHLSLDQDLNILSGEKKLLSFIDHTSTPIAQNKLIERLFTNLNHAQVNSNQLLIKNLLPNAWPLTKYYAKLKVFNSFKNFDFNPQSISQSLIEDKFYSFFALQILFYIGFWVSFFTCILYFPDVNLALPVTFFIILSFFLRGPFTKAFKKSQTLLEELSFLNFSLNLFQKHLPRNVKKCYGQIDPSLLKQGSHIHRYVSLLSIVTNPIAHIATNFILPWEPLTILFMEKWRSKNKSSFFKAIEFFHHFQTDLSFVLFSFFHSQCFPEITNSPQFKITKAYHPFISKEDRVCNSYDFQKHTCALLTGSNMAGKSTFMRTLGINQHLSQLGLPVFCDSMKTFIAPVESCLRVSDSLEEGVSSFYYEVKRIRQITQLGKNNQSFFFLIDEIFRGTNNKERQLGSAAIIKFLSQIESARGIISTHDLELAQIAFSHQKVENIHFADQWDDEKGLKFDYILKPGPSTTTNALQIMKINGLPID